MNFESIMDQVEQMILFYAPNVIKAILALIIGFWIIGRIMRVLRNSMEKREVDPSLGKFLASIASIGMKVMLLLAVASMFGFETTSFIAVITAMAFAIGLALQGSLGNFASGVMILLFKPFKIGDVVTAGGETGVVDEIQIFNTVIKSFDNQKIILPNSVVTSGVIKNINAFDTRRVDMVFGIGYGDDIDKAKSIIWETINANDKILKDPAPAVFVSELADSSVNFVVRPWTAPDDYWAVFFHMQETIKKRFDQEGINIPFPQMDVHLHKET